MARTDAFCGQQVQRVGYAFSDAIVVKKMVDVPADVQNFLLAL